MTNYKSIIYILLWVILGIIPIFSLLNQFGGIIKETDKINNVLIWYSDFIGNIFGSFALYITILLSIIWILFLIYGLMSIEKPN